MKLFTFDCETFLTRPGNQAPKMVCASTCYDGDDPKLFHAKFDREALLQELLGAFRDPDVLVVNQNIAFDVMVTTRWAPELLQEYFDLYDANRISDTMFRQILIALAHDKFQWDNELKRKQTYGLGEMSDYYLGIKLEKKGGPRTRYSEVMDVPISEWEDERIEYSLLDALLPIEIWKAQAKEARKENYELLCPLVDDEGFITAEHQEHKSALFAMSVQTWGMRTSKKALDALMPVLQQQVEEGVKKLTAPVDGDLSCTSLMDPEYLEEVVERYREFFKRKDAGEIECKPLKEGTWADVYEKKRKAYFDKNAQVKAIYKPKNKQGDLSKNTFVLEAVIYDAMEGNIELTDGGGVSTATEVLEGVEHPVVECFASFQSQKTDVETKIPKFYLGTDFPITTRYKTLIATGRWSSSKPNVQNITRAEGVREVFVPRPGTVYIDADYDSLEIRTWAHVCEQIVGFSTAAQNYRLNPSWDPHSKMGAGIAQTTYEDFFKNKKTNPEYDNARTTGKPITFGIPGGMGINTLIKSAKGYGVILDRPRAIQLRDIWRGIYPEWKDYFDYISTSSAAHGICKQIGTNRQRAGCGYTDFANSYFQGLAADLMKRVGWEIFKECYDENSPLFGCRVVNVIHDEFLLEAPLHSYQEAAKRLVEIMEQYGEQVVDVPIRAEVCAMDCWSKKAYPIYTEEGLQVWSQTKNC